jgi:hypothetical protein
MPYVTLLMLGLTDHFMLMQVYTRKRAETVLHVSAQAQWAAGSARVKG